MYPSLISCGSGLNGERESLPTFWRQLRNHSALKPMKLKFSRKAWMPFSIKPHEALLNALRCRKYRSLRRKGFSHRWAAFGADDYLDAFHFIPDGKSEVPSVPLSSRVRIFRVGWFLLLGRPSFWLHSPRAAAQVRWPAPDIHKAMPLRLCLPCREPVGWPVLEIHFRSMVRTSRPHGRDAGNQRRRTAHTMP